MVQNVSALLTGHHQVNTFVRKTQMEYLKAVFFGPYTS